MYTLKLYICYYKLYIHVSEACKYPVFTLNPRIYSLTCRIRLYLLPTTPQHRCKYWLMARSSRRIFSLTMALTSKAPTTIPWETRYGTRIAASTKICLYLLFLLLVRLLLTSSFIESDICILYCPSF